MLLYGFVFVFFFQFKGCQFEFIFVLLVVQVKLGVLWVDQKGWKVVVEIVYCRVISIGIFVQVVLELGFVCNCVSLVCFFDGILFFIEVVIMGVGYFVVCMMGMGIIQEYFGCVGVVEFIVQCWFFLYFVVIFYLDGIGGYVEKGFIVVIGVLKLKFVVEGGIVYVLIGVLCVFFKLCNMVVVQCIVEFVGKVVGEVGFGVVICLFGVYGVGENRNWFFQLIVFQLIVISYVQIVLMLFDIKVLVFGYFKNDRFMG